MSNKQLSKIDQRNKNLVHGYIRSEYEKKYQMNVPMALQARVIWSLSKGGDTFNNRNEMPKGIEINKNTVELKSQEYHGTVVQDIYGNNIISNGTVHEWKISLDAIGGLDEIGIESCEEKKVQLDSGQTEIKVSSGSEMRAIRVSSGQKVQIRGGGSKEMSLEWVTPIDGDMTGKIIEMKLDLQQQKLFYKVPEMSDYIPDEAFHDIPEASYRLKIHIGQYWKDVKYTLLEYKVTY